MFFHAKKLSCTKNFTSICPDQASTSRIKMIDRFLKTVHNTKKKKCSSDIYYRVVEPIGMPVTVTKIEETALNFRHVTYMLYCEERLYCFHFAPDSYEVTIEVPWNIGWKKELSLGVSDYTNKFFLEFALNEIP